MKLTGMFQNRCIVKAIETLFFNPPEDVDFKQDVNAFLPLPASLIAFVCVAVSLLSVQSDNRLTFYRSSTALTKRPNTAAQESRSIRLRTALRIVPVPWS
jgi:hypothetical protein